MFLQLFCSFFVIFLLNYTCTYSLAFCFCIIQVCEHYMARGLCTDFPDWSIAAAGSEANVRIGYDYGRFVTGEEQQIEPDLNEEAVHTDGDQVVPDPLEERSMVATSAEVYTCFFCLRLFNELFLCCAVYNFSFCVASGTRGARA